MHEDAHKAVRERSSTFRSGIVALWHCGIVAGAQIVHRVPLDPGLLSHSGSQDILAPQQRSLDERTDRFRPPRSSVTHIATFQSHAHQWLARKVTQRPLLDQIGTLPVQSGCLLDKVARPCIKYFVMGNLDFLGLEMDHEILEPWAKMLGSLAMMSAMKSRGIDVAIA